MGIFLVRRAARALVWGTALMLHGLALPCAGQGPSPTINKALGFDGRSTYLVAAPSPRAIGRDLTVEAWVLTTALRPQVVLSCLADSAGAENGLALGTDQGRAVLFRRGPTGQRQGLGPAGPLVADGRWHHLAGVVSGPLWQLFVDGEPTGPAALAPLGQLLQTRIPLVLGALLNGPTPAEFFDGELDEVRLWRVAHSLAEVRARMCLMLGRPFILADYPNLAAYFACDGLPAGGGTGGTGAQAFNFTNGALRLSGAPLGDRSASRYEPTRLLGRLTFPGPTGQADSVVLSGFAAGLRGVQVYGLAAGVFGVFTVGGALRPPATAFTLRYRTGGCQLLLRRALPFSPWANTGARLDTTRGYALILPVQYDRAEFAVEPAPLPYCYLTGPTALCPGQGAVLRAMAPTGTRFRWSTGATTDTLVVTTPGRYALRATFTGGCPAQQVSWELQAGTAAPPFSLGPDTVLCAGQRLALAGPAGPGLRYEWDDGSALRTRSCTESGRYTLVVRGSCGLPQTASVLVRPRNCLFVPTVITPNNDGRNDRLVVQTAQPTRWALDLYNRWGQVVLHTDDYRHDWGDAAAPGLYFVLLRQPATGFVYKGWLEVLP